MSTRLFRVMFLSSLAASLCVALSNSAVAHMGSGGDCSACHGTPATDKMTVEPGSLLPNSLAVNPRLDAGGNTSSLKSFTVSRGETVQIKIDVANIDNIDDQFGVALTGTVKGSPPALEALLSNSTVKGVQTDVGNLLSFTPDALWTTKKATTTPYFTATSSSVVWDGTPTSYTYNLTVGADTPLDVYSLTCRTTGVNYDTGDMWTQSEEILVNVVSAVPEPSSVVLLLTTGLGLLFYRSRRRRNS